MSDEIPNMAPGLVQAFATQEDAPREGETKFICR